MEMDVFAAKVCAAVKKKLSDDYKVEIKEIRKNNGVRMKGLVISSGEQKTVPTMYLDVFLEAYEGGKPFDEVVDTLLEIYQRDALKARDITLDGFDDFENVKNNICYRLVGKEHNEEFLEDAPHMDFLDLAICFFYDYCREGMGEGIITIHNAHMEMWGVCTEELFRQAQKNTPRLFPMEYSTMKEVFQELPKKGKESSFIPESRLPDIPMRILSNTRRTHGAASILYPGVLEEIAKREGRSFYIIPSSIHETIVLLDNGGRKPEEFKRIIEEVNRDQVAMEEVLSDSLYYYDSVRKEIMMM